MKRISTSTRVVNKFGAGKDGFTDGNADTGIPATDLEAALFDHLQEEVCGVVEAAGIALDAANRAQLLAALRSAGVFQTPAQFDSTTRVATTGFVKKSGISLFDQKAFAVSAAILPADAGRRLTIDAAGITLTLPAANSVPPGAVFTIGVGGHASSSTIVAAATNSFEGGGSSIVVSPNSQLILMSDGGGTWLRIADTTNSGFTLRNPAALGGSGYQRLPSGLIVQWGAFTITSANVFQDFALAIAFPNAGYSVAAQRQNQGAANNYASTNVYLLNTTTVRASASEASTITYLAVGK